MCIRDRLDATPPETSGPALEVGSLGGLTVTAQARTTMEDAVRVAIPDAHTDVNLVASDLNRNDPATLITRLERLLHRVPDRIAELREEAAAARSEVDRAEARIGASWDRTDELAGLRRRQQEIDDQLATPATADPPREPSATADATGLPAVPSAVVTPSIPTLIGRSSDRGASAEHMAALLDSLQQRSGNETPGVGI